MSHPPPPADGRPAISVIVPTYREAENLPPLLARLDAVRRAQDLTLEVLFLDDNSRDGSIEAVAAAGHPWARMIVRTGPRGLSPAVLDGLRAARHPILVVMDADLSHPPETLPALVDALADGELAMGSRYVAGGTTDDQWGLFRWLNSRIATWLARPLTTVSDPMSGFFALRRVDFDRADALNPVGYKIALELIVKARLRRVRDIPIHFRDRVAGESKLTLAEQLKYLQHLGRLYRYRWPYAVEGLGHAVAAGLALTAQAIAAEVASALGVPIGLATAAAAGAGMLAHRGLVAPNHDRPRRGWRDATTVVVGLGLQVGAAAVLAPATARGPAAFAAGLGAAVVAGAIWVRPPPLPPSG